jgi:hypothetical protein
MKKRMLPALFGKTAFLLALVVTALASLPAHAQPLRVFVSSTPVP